MLSVPCLQNVLSRDMVLYPQEADSREIHTPSIIWTSCPYYSPFHLGRRDREETCFGEFRGSYAGGKVHYVS